MTQESSDVEVVIPVRVPHEKLPLLNAAARETHLPVDMFIATVSADRAGQIMDAIAEGQIQIKFSDDQGRTIPSDHDPKPDQS